MKYTLAFFCCLIALGQASVLAQQPPAGATTNDAVAQAKAWNEKAAEAYRAKDYEQAIEMLGKAIALDPTRVVYTLNGADVYEAAQQFEKTRQWLEAQLPAFPAATDQRQLQNALGGIHARQAQSLADKGRYAEAIPHFQATVEIDKAFRPEALSSALNALGDAYRLTSRYDKAIESFEGAIAQARQTRDANDEIAALNNLGWTYQNLHQYEKAAAQHEQAFALARAAPDLERQLSSATHLFTLLWV